MNDFQFGDFSSEDSEVPYLCKALNPAPESGSFVEFGTPYIPQHMYVCTYIYMNVVPLGSI